jgi:hypothetical protein
VPWFEQWSIERMLNGIANGLTRRSSALLLSIEGGLDRIMQFWLLFAGLACALRIATSPMYAPVDAGTLIPYLLLIFAPFASMVLALRWFDGGDQLPQPRTRLAVLGKWRAVDAASAKAHRLYGPNGVMVSLLVGMLLNVPVRATEYLAAMPALTGPVPAWLSTLHFLLTWDVVVFSSLYSVAFVAALRCVPLFPRLLVAIWIGDLAMQLVTANLVAATPGLPADVAGPLQTLITGNIKKVLIGVALWLPYVLLSRRVNITYRHRVEA